MHKNAKKLMVKSVFECDASFKNYRKKWKRLDWAYACRHVLVCVIRCQLLSGVMTRLRR